VLEAARGSFEAAHAAITGRCGPVMGKRQIEQAVVNAATGITAFYAAVIPEPCTASTLLVIAVALACFYLVLAVIRPGGLGLGDAKLAASVGAALGWISWQAVLFGTFAAFVLAGVYGGALLALHRATRTSQLPLGPFIL
jgi:prepilin signal peptidase PulO-like enzyme (type II secretory pathway)